MKIINNIVFCTCFFSALICDASGVKSTKSVAILFSGSAHVRVKYGVQKLEEQLREEGYAVTEKSNLQNHGSTIIIGLLNDALIKKYYTHYWPGSDSPLIKAVAISQSTCTFPSSKGHPNMNNLEK